VSYKGNLLVKPSINIEFKGEKWHLRAGFKMAVENGEDTRFFFFPKAEFKYNVVGNLIVPYLGVTGGAERNSFQTLRQQNPFLYEYAELKTTRTAYDVYLGVRGLISANLSYNISGGYKAVKDMVLFTSNLSTTSTQPYYENVYQPVYDTVNVAHVAAQVNYQRSTKWNVMWRVNYNMYETQREVKAWNLPDFTSDLTLNYNLQEKILVKSSLTFMNSKYVKTSDTAQEELAFGVYGRKIDPIIDFNIGLEYRFTKKVSAFLDVNNILSQNYEVWGNYRVQGLNVLGGVTIAFWDK
jgi:outer membrane receptor protein involved in Fe transport